MNTPIVKGKYWSILVTLTVISLGLIYYFIIHTNRKESEIKEKAYRDLNRFVYNYQQKHTTYTKNAGYIFDLAYEREKTNPSALKLYNKDSISKIREENKTNSHLKFCGIHTTGTTCKLDKHSLLFIGLPEQKNNSLPGIQFTTSISKFVEPLFKNTLFDEYIIVQNISPVPGKHDRKTILEYNSVLSNLKVDIPDNDSLISQIEIGENKFIAFKTSFETPSDNSIIDFYGLIPLKTYQLSMYKLDIWLVILLVLLLLILLLAIPIIKLLVLSSIEEISVKDYLLIGLSIYMGSSILFLLFLSISNSISENKNIDQNLVGLTVELETNFKTNIKNAAKQIDYYEIKFDTADTIIKQHNDSGSYYIDDIFNKPAFRPDIFPDIKLAFWINDKGKQKIVYSIFPEKGNFSDLSHRNYFKQPMINDFWDIETENNREIVVESIRSISSGECLAAISSKSNLHRFDTLKDLRVAVVTTPMHALTQASLPHGYEFIIIDNIGDVWFHSNNEFNLQENFLAESTGSSKLASIIANRSNQFFNCNYHGKRYRGTILPIKGTPLQVVAIHDKNIASSLLSQIISISFIFVLLSYGVVFIQALILLMLLKTTRSKLYTKLAWLKYWDTEDSKKTYVYLLKTNSLIILIIILLNWLFGHFFASARAVGYISTIFTTIVAFAVNYYYLSEQFASLVQNPFSGKTIMAASIKSKFLLLSTIFLLIATLVSLYLHKITDVLIAMVTILMVLLVYLLSKKDNVPKVKNGQLFFLGVYVSWIVLLGFLPAYYAFKTSYSLEHESFTKQALYESAKSIEDNTTAIETFYKKMSLQDNNFVHSKIENTFYSQGFEIEDIFPDNRRIPNRFDTIYHNYLPGFNGISKTNRCFILNSPGDENWQSVIRDKKIYLKKNSSDTGPIILSGKQNKGRLLKISEKHPITSVVLILIILIFFFTSIIIIIRFLSGKLYGIGLIRKYTSDIKVEETATRQTFRFIVGLSGSGKTLTYKTKAANGLYINLKRLHNPESWENIIKDAKNVSDGSIVVDNFEYGLNDLVLWSKKLDLMNLLYRKESINVYVLSQIHPEQLFRVYDYFVQNGVETKTSEGQKVSINYNAEYFEWQQILDRYTLSYLPLTTERIDSILGLTSDQKNIIKSKWKIGFESDKQEAGIEYLNFFKKPGKILNVALNNRDESFLVSLDQIKEAGGEKQFVPKHQLLYNYYFSVWKSLPIEEKYILFDFAQDGLLNSNNQKAITSLSNKGLLVDEGSVALINDSFRYFILDVLQPKVELKQSREILEKGKWNRFRFVLLIVIFALFALLWIGSKEFIGEIKAILIAAAGIATALLKFRDETGSLFGKG